MKSIAFIITILAMNLVSAKSLNCMGSDPDWSATINMDRGITQISDPTKDRAASIKTQIIAPVSTFSDYAFLAKGKFTSLAVMKNPTCDDGKTSEKYQYSVMVIGYASNPLVGCCK